MSLAARLQPSGAMTDKVLAAYEALPTEADRDALKAALLDKNFSGGDIARALKAEGFDVDGGQVAHLRRKLASGKAFL